MKISCDRKAVLVTGCDSGFGYDLVKRLDRLGFYVFAACLDVDGSGPKELVRETSRNVEIIQLDVTNTKQAENALNHVTFNLNDKDFWCLVNNAGVAVYAETEWCPLESYTKMIEVNLVGVIRVTKLFLPLVRKSKGRIVNISSLAGRCGLPGFSAYSASKYGLIGYSDCLRREMEKFNVKVITIEPTLYRTPIADRDFHIKGNEKMWKACPSNIREDYGDSYFKSFLISLQKHIRMSSNQTWRVIDTIEQAMTARYPKTRYVPECLISVLSDIFITLPNIIQDAAVALQMNVRCKPKSMLRQ